MLVVWLLFLLNAVVHVSYASDDEYLRSLQDPFLDGVVENTCTPNDGRTGVVCEDIILFETNIAGEPVRIHLFRNTTFEDPVFLTDVQVFAFYSQTDHRLFGFEFNSSTPNNTVLSSGSTHLGPINLDTGNFFYPNIPVDFDVSHNVTLLTFDCANSSTNSFCQSGEIVANVGITGQGEASYTLSTISLNIDEPTVMLATVKYSDTVDDTLFCQDDLSVATTVDANIDAHVQICIGSFPCINETHHIEVDNVNQNRTLVENQCFNRTVEVPSV